MEDYGVLKKKCKHFERLACLKNERMLKFVAEYVTLCNPKSVFVRTDSKEDAEYVRNKAVEAKEELRLDIPRHTAHFDGIYDQARDKENTKFLLTPDMMLEPKILSVPRDSGLDEMRDLLKDIMAGKELFVLFLCLGPVDSEFSIYAVQLTDSSYVAHSEDILYRPGYEIFKKKKGDMEFLRYVHSAGELQGHVSKNVDKRRIYIDLLKNMVYSVNTQYAGNTVGFKKLALRLAIKKADSEGWLAEHMFVMGVHGQDNRKTYFLGAFPSFCGKTSTCMVNGETVVGDDIAYLRRTKGKIYAVNVERGIFGIIRDINKESDPLIWKALTTEDEAIFSNVLIEGNIPRWQGDNRKEASSGINYSGNWLKGKKDDDGTEIPLSHPNARYTVRLKSLKNCDTELENPRGVEVSGIVYGGRDSDTWPPVFQSFDWIHGVVTMGASLESETTAATLGKVGIRKFNLMANLDFLSIPMSKYVRNHLDFGKDIRPPLIFGVNYFLKDEAGEYLTDIHDKYVWLKWMELRVNKEVEAIKTPIGYFPEYEDLKRLFKEVLSKDYSEDDYARCFTLREQANIAKIDRIKNIYRDVEGIPVILFEVLEAQKERLEKSQGG